jgi:4-amino-4-deoxychorismate lyase
MTVLAVAAAGAVVDGDRPALDPLDLALVRGEAVFETVRVHRGRPFRLGAHLERLAASAAALDLVLPEGMEELARRAVAAAGERDAMLRLVCTRGREAAAAPAAFAICSAAAASSWCCSPWPATRWCGRPPPGCCRGSRAPATR